MRYLFDFIGTYCKNFTLYAVHDTLDRYFVLRIQ